MELPVSADQVFKDFQKLPEEERQHVIAKIFKLRQTSPQMDILSIRNNEITKEVISPQREQTHKTIKKFQKLLSLLKTPIDTLNVDDEDFPSTYYLLKSLNPHDFFQIEGIITT